MNNKNYITTKGFAKLKKEFHDLVHKERPRVVDVVSWAAGNGDRSENGDYIYGKKRLREIDKRIHQLKKKIEAAEVINPLEIKNDRVVFSATVSVEDEQGQQSTYSLVGEDESEAEKGKISWKSPLAKALLGKKVGELVVAKLPKGDRELEILKIEYKDL